MLVEEESVCSVVFAAALFCSVLVVEADWACTVESSVLFVGVASLISTFEEKIPLLFYFPYSI